MKRKNFVTIFILIITSVFAAMPVSAQPIPTSPSDKGLGCGGGLGPIAEALCNIGKNDKAIVGNMFNRMASGVVGFLTIVSALWFILQFIIAGYQWIGAGGDKNATEAARNKLSNSVIGLLIIVSAWVIVGLIGKIMGLDILNPGGALQMIGF